MAIELTVSEPDVLFASTLFLIERGITPYQFSVAAGKGIDNAGTTSLLREAFASVGRSPSFTGKGADIYGFSDSEQWIIECKGSGTGKPQTQRNNFDRALASVVSYFEDEPQDIPQKKLKVCLGLALPTTGAYMNELRRRVRAPLRRQLNLYILLYDPVSKKIRLVTPDESY